jgi:hypothetical protein
VQTARRRLAVKRLLVMIGDALAVEQIGDHQLGLAAHHMACLGAVDKVLRMRGLAAALAQNAGEEIGVPGINARAVLLPVELIYPLAGRQGLGTGLMSGRSLTDPCAAAGSRTMCGAAFRPFSFWSWRRYQAIRAGGAGSAGLAVSTTSLFMGGLLIQS